MTMTVMNDEEWNCLFQKARCILDHKGLMEIHLQYGRKMYHGDAPVVLIETFPSKGKTDIIKKLESIREFRGYKYLDTKSNHYEYAGWFYLNN